MVIDWFVLTEVIIQEKRGSFDPLWTVLELDHSSSFFGAGGLAAGFTAFLTSGFGAGAASTFGSGSWFPLSKSPNLLIVFNEYFLIFIKQQVPQTLQESSYSSSWISDSSQKQI